ncbi:metal-dependent hydrolase [Rhodospirillaceae bacterium KN72]|uniref:Metal-dependent hydrolase n=1 Tax=Pacificispira spongiicola TaxID=2729598 RepID=A0A7Y0DYU6_9PROT|nr:metal-dependent hydrolase [Pacificispira spongiicola]NMM44112.1 metal-dependent hydrolase [Pacificispira spongiicola]
MDSATQFVLGACVGTSVLGRCLGPRKAAVLGGVLGSMPDMDVFYPFDDPVDSFVLHRSATHSLVMHALATPIFGEAILRLFKYFRDNASENRVPVYAAAFLCFTTHALLDAFTIYGTQLFWPITDYPVGIGSVFIIDPLYTLPLLVATIWALCLRQWNGGIRKALSVGLVLSSGYLAWTLGAQQWALAKAETALGRTLGAGEALSIPTPFNTLFWKVIVLADDRYANIYVPLFAGQDATRVYVHARTPAEGACLDAIPDFRRLADFAKGFYRIEEIENGDVAIADLRMGLTPNYVFRFDVARHVDGGLVETAPPIRVASQRNASGDLDWLLSGIRGIAVPRTAEEDALGTDFAALSARVGSTKC